MVFYIILVASIICGIYWVVEMLDGGVVELIFGIMGGIIVGAITGLIVLLPVYGLLQYFTDREYALQETNEIVSLGDNFGQKSLYFLGMGMNDSDSEYAYLIRNDEGFKMKSAKTEHGALIYSKEPKIEKYKDEFTNKFVRLLFGEPMFSDPKYKIYIPEGSINFNFKVDLQ